MRLICANRDRRFLALDEGAAGVVGLVLLNVSLSLLSPLWRERFSEPMVELTLVDGTRSDPILDPNQVISRPASK